MIIPKMNANSLIWFSIQCSNSQRPHKYFFSSLGLINVTNRLKSRIQINSTHHYWSLHILDFFEFINSPSFLFFLAIYSWMKSDWWLCRVSHSLDVVDYICGIVWPVPPAPVSPPCQPLIAFMLDCVQSGGGSHQRTPESLFILAAADPQYLAPSFHHVAE